MRLELEILTENQVIFGMQGKQDGKTTASMSLSIVRIGPSDGIALEGSFQDGLKRETLRSLCQITNGTKLRLEVCLTDAPDEWEEVSSSAPSQMGVSQTSASQQGRRSHEHLVSHQAGRAIPSERSNRASKLLLQRPCSAARRWKVALALQKYTLLLSVRLATGLCPWTSPSKLKHRRRPLGRLARR